MYGPPGIKGFRPYGSRGKGEFVKMLYEEFEALKLADYENLNQEDAAKRMNVSRPTFTRIYDSALKKIALAFVEKREIIIEGGNVQFDDEWFRCNKCHTSFKTSKNVDDVKECSVCSSPDIFHENSQFDN